MSPIAEIQNSADHDIIEPLSPLEKLPQPAQDIYADEVRAGAEMFAGYEASQKRRDELRLEKAGYQADLARNERAARPSAKLEERLNIKIETANAAIRKVDDEHEAWKAGRAGSAVTLIRDDFLNTPLVHRRWKAAGTVVTLRPGLTLRETADALRADRKAKMRERVQVLKAPLTAEEIRSEIATGVHRAGSKALSIAVNSAKRVDIDERGRISPRGFKLPSVTIPTATMLVDHGDGLGILAAIFPSEMIQRLTDMALASHDESAALDLAERAERLREIDAAISAIDYQSEAIHRQARAEGSNAGPRLTNNVLAILDLIPA